MNRSPRHPSRRGRGAALLLLALAGAGCATAKKQEELRWPLPPDPARVKFVRAFRQDEDLKSSAFRSAMRALVSDTTRGLIDQPTGLALSVDEKTLYVVSPTATPIVAVDLAAGKMRKFADRKETRPASAYGVAVDGEDNVYVSDSSSDVVRVYKRDGDLLRKIEGHLDRPTGIAVDRRRQLVYVVSGAERESQEHRVEVFSLKGQHLRSIGTRGTNPGEFNFPTQLAVTKSGSLLVVDMLNFRVQEFDGEGNLVGLFGSSGQGPGQFDKAKGVATDAFGNIYVTDSQLGIVQMFNPKYQVLMAFGGKLEKLGYMLLPTAIVIDSKNTIYVADYAGRCVSEYQLVNTSAADSFPADVPADGQKPAGGAGASQKPQGG